MAPQSTFAASFKVEFEASRAKVGRPHAHGDDEVASGRRATGKVQMRRRSPARVNDVVPLPRRRRPSITQLLRASTRTSSPSLNPHQLTSLPSSPAGMSTLRPSSPSSLDLRTATSCHCVFGNGRPSKREIWVRRSSVRRVGRTASGYVGGVGGLSESTTTTLRSAMAKISAWSRARPSQSTHE